MWGLREEDELQIRNPKYIKLSTLLKTEGQNKSLVKDIKRFFLLFYKNKTFIAFELAECGRFCVDPLQVNGQLAAKCIPQLNGPYRFRFFLTECDDGNMLMKINFISRACHWLVKDECYMSIESKKKKKLK